MLPYGTGICCYAVIVLNFLLLLSNFLIFFYIYTFFKSGMDKSTEWSTIRGCPSHMCFFNRDDTEGTNSLQILGLMFVYVLFYADLCQN